jgi:hypothetical protein
MTKLPGRDGHGVKNPGRRKARAATQLAVWNALHLPPGKRLTTADGTVYVVGHLELLHPDRPDDARQAWMGHELHRVEP